MSLRRGFKSDANWYSRQARHDIGLKPHEPFCVKAFANCLEIEIIALSQFNKILPNEVSTLQGVGSSKVFSAVTIKNPYGLFIIHNDAHTPKRQKSNIAHELSHAFLNHPFPPIQTECGIRHYDEEMEEEANWLGPALLISEEAAMFIGQRGMSIAEASDIFGATEDIVRMRMNICGVRKRLSRRQ